MSPAINVFVSYADSFVGKRVLAQFQQSPSLYRVYACTWDPIDSSETGSTSAFTDPTGVFGAASNLTPGNGPSRGGSAGPDGQRQHPAAGDVGFSTVLTSPHSASTSIFSRHDIDAVRSALLACDLIVLELKQAQAVIEAVQFIVSQPSFPRPKRLVLLSSLMTWYATPPLEGGRNTAINNNTGAVGEEEDDDDNMDGEIEAGLDDPYPAPPAQMLEKMLETAQNAARHALVDAMRGDGDATAAAQAMEEGEGDEGEEDDTANAADASGDGASTEVLTEDQYNRRVPHLHYLTWRDAEKAVAAAHHAKGLPLDTFVICSGLPYGGEEDALEPIFRLAWAAQPERAVRAADSATPSITPATLPIFGNGRQCIPLVHAQDLACFVRKLLRCPRASLPFPERRYLFATDGSNENSWRAIVRSVNRMFGDRCAMQRVTPADYPLYRDVDRFTLDLRVEAESMRALMDMEEEEERGEEGGAVPPGAAPLPKTWIAADGLRRHLRTIAAEFKHCLHVEPLRLALVGPPLVGKSYLATRLARHYRLPCLSLDSVVQDYKTAQEGLQRRLSDTKAAMIEAERTRRLQMKRQRVLRKQQEDWDTGRTTNSASGGMQEDDAEDSEEGESTGEKARVNAAVNSQDPEAAAAHAIPLASAEEEEVADFVESWWDGQPLVQAWTDKIAEMERVLLLRLHPKPSTPDANPKRRAANNAGGGGSKKKGNSGKDGQRSKEEDEEMQQLKANLSDAPFQTRALVHMLRWRLAQPDCHVQGFVLDGIPPTLELTRAIFTVENAPPPPTTEEEALRPRYAVDEARSATAALQSAAGGTDGGGNEDGSGGAAGPAVGVEAASAVRLPDHVIVLEATDAFLLNRLKAMGAVAEQRATGAATESDATHPVDLDAFHADLATYKREYVEAAYSVLSYFECAATAADGGGDGEEGVTMVRRAMVHSVTVEGHEPLVPAPPPSSAYAILTPGETEQYLCDTLIGRPHNFGQSVEEVQREAVRQAQLDTEVNTVEAEVATATAAAETQECEAEKQNRAAEAAKAAALLAADLAELEERKKPLTNYLQQRVLPLLHKGLLEVCAARPTNPVDFLAEWLIHHNPHDDIFCDI